MIIYQDLISHDEMFSYIYKIREMANKLCLELSVGQRLKCLSEGLESERTDATVSTGADVVINHHLQETSFTKEFYKKRIKDYMKSIKGRLEERNPDRVKPFMRRAAEQMKRILANF